MPNNDYILRSKALKAVCETCSEHGEEGESCASHCGDYALIQNIPAADVEPVRHGRWIDKSNDEYAYYCENVYQCSACGEEWDILEGTPKQNSYHYCPNCGAKMDDEPPKEGDDG
jgi:DNA-directed RNA polymerase subunit RPC12/RpoP